MSRPKIVRRQLARFILLALSFMLVAPDATRAADFQISRPGRSFQFPRDHGAHPEFKTEWWYWVGHLKSERGETFGYQLTFFRVALRKPDPQARSAWALNTVYFAHLALSDPAHNKFIFREKAGRDALKLSGATAGEPFKVWIDSWQAELTGETFHLTAADEGLALDLFLKPSKPPALHGESGFSGKSARDNSASYYYSISRLATQGTITLAGRSFTVTGESWMDHEFFTSAMAPGQVGWDWFGLQLSDGTDIMLYLLRHQDGSIDAASSGTLINPQGGTRHLKLSDFQVKANGSWTSPHTRTKYPAGWEIAFPGAGYALTLTPTLSDQEIRAGTPAAVTYWEGAIKISGRKNGQPITGQGFAELTGYAGAMGGRF